MSAEQKSYSRKRKITDITPSDQDQDFTNSLRRKMNKTTSHIVYTITASDDPNNIFRITVNAENDYKVDIIDATTQSTATSATLKKSLKSILTSILPSVSPPPPSNPDEKFCYLDDSKAPRSIIEELDYEDEEEERKGCLRERVNYIWSERDVNALMRPWIYEEKKECVDVVQAAKDFAISQTCYLLVIEETEEAFQFFDKMKLEYRLEKLKERMHDFIYCAFFTHSQVNISNCIRRYVSLYCHKYGKDLSHQQLSDSLFTQIKQSLEDRCIEEETCYRGSKGYKIRLTYMKKLLDFYCELAYN